MIFEVVGVDGSGKTTLIHSLRRAINEGGSAYAYERPFQSEGVRLLEAAASAGSRARPFSAFGTPIVEHVRTVELVRRSFELAHYQASRVQHVFTDSYVVEQRGRLIQAGLGSPELDSLLGLALRPALIFYLEIDAATAVDRMRKRSKGDAMLLSADPEAQARAAISGLSEALKNRGDLPLVRLDAARSPEELAMDALARVIAVSGDFRA